jgi:hypothetical protein
MIPKNSIDDVDIVDKLMDKRYPLSFVDLSIAGIEIVKLRNEINILRNKLELKEEADKNNEQFRQTDGE